MPTVQDKNTIQSFFAEHGYYLAQKVFSPGELDILRSDFDRIVNQIASSNENVNARWESKENDKIDGGKPTVVYHTHNVHQYSAVWAKAMYQEKFINVAKSILGEDIVLHHTKLFQKPPANGAPFPTHQDWPYFPTKHDSMIAGVIHISQATDEMGCFRIFPGSHKLGRIENSDGQKDCPLLEKYPINQAIALEAEPGDVVFFHYFTLHGSLPNVSKNTRKTVLVQMYSGNDQVESADHQNLHYNDRLMLSGWNSKMKRSVAGNER